jgi:prostamide/prostaglandin F2alpha synthase
LIGIGLEPLGLEEFLAGNFFSGELFVDKDKASFSRLGFKRFSLLSVLSAIVSKKAREAIAKAKVRYGYFIVDR